jgi:hypothetical protein
VAGYVARHPSGSFADALEAFALAARVSGAFFLGETAQMVQLARLLER